MLELIIARILDNLVYILAGLVGGFARAFFGLYKAVNAGMEINTWHFIITVISAGFIGGILGTIFKVDYRFASLIGFVGTDFLENVLEGSMKKNIALQKTG